MADPLTFVGDSEADAAQAWATEVKRRVEEVQGGQVEGDPLDDAIAELDGIVARAAAAPGTRFE